MRPPHRVRLSGLAVRCETVRQADTGVVSHRLRGGRYAKWVQSTVLSFAWQEPETL